MLIAGDPSSLLTSTIIRSLLDSMDMNYFVSRRGIMALNVGGDAWPGGKCDEADCQLPMLC